MQYSEFGKTGFKISKLGFGAMRLPMHEDEDGKQHVKTDEAIEMIHFAFENGVNYIDTAYVYSGGESEVVVGKALKGWRDKVKVATKLPTWQCEKKEDFRILLEEQLEKLDVDCIDFYHFHGLGKGNWEGVILKHDYLSEAEKARDEGLIEHLCFSFHDDPGVMKEIIDGGNFASVLCQYNLLDRANEDSIAYAREKGVGVVAMGPVGGGQLAYPLDYLENAIPESGSCAEIALRFVLANENVNCALSGMGSMRMVEENVAIASTSGPLTGEQIALVEKAVEERKALAELYCTGCGYCMPCPQNVDIPGVFSAMNLDRVYKMPEHARRKYRNLNKKDGSKRNASACVECGTCEPKCPQKIPIIKQLKETDKALSE